jgi:hypothetical protein
MNDVSANQITADTISANRVEAQNFGGKGGGGAVLVADKIILGGWVFESAGDGVYVTTPDGIKTKMELIDFRQTPVPETATLTLEPAQESVAPVAASTGTTGAGIGDGNYIGGGGYAGVPTAPNANSPVKAVGDQTGNNNPAGPGKVNPGAGTGYQPISDNGITTLAKLKHPLDKDEPFKNGLDVLAKELNIAVDNLLIVFWVESRIDPTAVNPSPQSGASGLNQIMPKTANGLGYTIEQIRKMSAAEQITGPSLKYFQNGKRQTPGFPNSPSLTDVYLLNFYPAAVGKDDDFVIGGELIWRLNKIYQGPDGKITVGSTKKYFADHWGAK